MLTIKNFVENVIVKDRGELFPQTSLKNFVQYLSPAFISPKAQLKLAPLVLHFRFFGGLSPPK